jgi:hypothetical protein
MGKTFLLFEDEQDAGEQLLNELTRQSGDDEHRVVWFKRGFDPPAGRQVYPVSVEDGFELPEVFAVTKAGRRPLDSAQTWRQSQFDAAILDLILQKRGIPVGFDYAEWLELAGFRGPVVIVSQQDRDQRQFKSLDILHLHKLEDEWERRAINRVLIGTRAGVTGERKPQRRFLPVNYLGREPITLLSSFYAQSGGTQQDWRCIYFGRDEQFEKHLRQFFDLKPYASDKVIYPISDLENVLKEADKQGRKPKVVFIDCEAWVEKDDENNERTNRLTDSLARLACAAFSGLAARPIGMFLGKLDACKRERSALAGSNAVFVQRDKLLTAPSVWAGEAVERFAISYSRLWEEAKKLGHKKGGLLPTRLKNKGGVVRKDEEGKIIMKQPPPWPPEILHAGAQMIEALLPAYLMARSSYRLAGDPNIPVSLADWIGTPAVRQLNTNFCHDLDDILRQLKLGRAVTDQQVELYSKA